MSCPDDEALLAFAQGDLPGDERARIEDHLDGCDECRSAVAEAARALFERTGPTVPVPADDDRPLPRGTRVSRYEILEVQGMGGAGVVYRAFDPELARPVALKLIRPDVSRGGSRGTAGSRLQREARAMAQLAHPNVVAVYDTGTYEGHVFVVMELVEGKTLGEWLRERKRPWHEVLGLFLEAGRGLAAAHAAGLVHRDFKPENVLVGSDGRARVTDFGLARPTGPGVLPEPPSETGDDAGAAEITRLAGTPAYMAPEQFLGLETDARTDQFSFCVALYLALYGRHPFGIAARKRQPLLTMAEPVIAGRLEPPPEATEVPEGLGRLLLRGLSSVPAERYPSLDELLAQLARWRRPELVRLRRLARMAAPPGAALLVCLAALLASADGRMWLAALASRCGNGVVEAGEQCDDGNASDADACLGTCRFATCGDGKLRAHVEECDDGNARDGDGCSASCRLCRSGDAAFTWVESGHCYSRHDVPMSWDDARRLCAREGGDVASLTSGYEAESVYTGLVAGVPLSPWVGFHDAESDGRFVWVTGETTASGNTPVPFHPQAGDERRCVHVRTGRLDSGQKAPFHFEAVECSATAPVLCEQARWLTSPRDNHAYVVVSQAATWAAAREDCAARGGHLATITSAEEQSFLVREASQALWIGASDAQQEGVFTWVTGEPFAFTAWVAREPDDYDGRADCVNLGLDKGWHDRICDEPNPYVCEFD